MKCQNLFNSTKQEERKKDKPFFACNTHNINPNKINLFSINFEREREREKKNE